MSNKGRLHEPTTELLERTGLHLDNGTERRLCAGAVDPDMTVLFAHATDIPEYVHDGAAEIGITGLDQVRESSHELEDLLDLEYEKCRLVLATPEDGDIETVTDTSGEVVVIEFPHIIRTHFEGEGISAEVVEITGATELTLHIGMVDTITDIMSTGTTLRVNRLAVIDGVLSSSIRPLTRPDAVDDPKVQQLFVALESVQSAGGKRCLMMNALHEKLDEVKEVTPGPDGPTVMDVIGDSTVTVYAVVNGRGVFEAVSDLKNVGASGTFITEIEQLIE